MTVIVGVIACALLFALCSRFAIGGACHGHCDSCQGSCPLTESDNARH